MDLLAALTAATFALVGVALGHLLAARSDNRADRWRRREETMRMLRWAVELASSDDNRGGILGAAALEALLDSELLQPEDADMVERLANHARADAAGIHWSRPSGDEGGVETHE